MDEGKWKTFIINKTDILVTVQHIMECVATEEVTGLQKETPSVEPRTRYYKSPKTQHSCKALIHTAQHLCLTPNTSL